MSVSNGDRNILSKLQDDEVSISIFKKGTSPSRNMKVSVDDAVKAFPVLENSNLRLLSNKGPGARAAGANFVATVPAFTEFRNNMWNRFPDGWSTDMFLCFGSSDGNYSMKVYFQEVPKPRMDNPPVENSDNSDNSDNVEILNADDNSESAPTDATNGTTEDSN